MTRKSKDRDALIEKLKDVVAELQAINDRLCEQLPEEILDARDSR